MTQRQAELHTARVLIEEARKRRQNGESHMASVMLAWAQNARRRAALCVVEGPAQGRLF
jgi:hypothetical protein